MWGRGEGGGGGGGGGGVEEGGWRRGGGGTRASVGTLLKLEACSETASFQAIQSYQTPYFVDRWIEYRWIEDRWITDRRQMD